MAKQKNGVNLSEEVRKVLAPNPHMTVAEVVADLAGKNIKVKKSLVYVVRNKMRLKKKKQRREKAKQAVNSGDPVATIKKVKNLAEELGGMRKLREIVEILAE